MIRTGIAATALVAGLLTSLAAPAHAGRRFQAAAAQATAGSGAVTPTTVSHSAWSTGVPS